MFKKVLIANRGEIALRVIRTLKELGVASVAIYSEADADSRHVEMADDAICIGPKEASKSYLSMPAIISAALISKAEAIHPGYGFLSENPVFAEACAFHNIVFIGPSPETMKLMGNKAEAKKVIEEAGLPVVPGIDVDTEKNSELVRKLEKGVGFPLMIKAAYGGGGKGIRLVRNHDELMTMVETAKIEAESAFGMGHIYIEKFVEKPRHLELQVVADSYGNVAILGERDCSVQRRHQKLIEETPCPVLSDEKREEIFERARVAMRKIGYLNAGTIEFLLDKDGNYYFMEMNARLQVEHPVTEMVTGIDIVREQILIAAGEKISFDHTKIERKGASIEFRINAEDPKNNFMPSPGVINHLRLPGGMGVRIDTHIYEGYKIPPYYDSLIAKVIVWGKDRKQALERGKRALAELDIRGIHTTKEFQMEILNNEHFRNGDVSTDFVEEMIKEREIV